MVAISDLERTACAAFGARGRRVRAELVPERDPATEGFRTSNVRCSETVRDLELRLIRLSSRLRLSGLIPIISHRLRKAKML